MFVGLVIVGLVTRSAGGDGVITYADFSTSLGDFNCVFYRDKAPVTVENFISLVRGTKTWTDPRTSEKARKPLYNGLTFHRVVPGQIIEGGDPLGDGSGGPGFSLDPEFHPDLKHDIPGRLTMVKYGERISGCQFAITAAPAPWLDGQCTVFGQVVRGMDVVRKITLVPRDAKDRPLTPVIIKVVRISGVYTH